MLQSRSVGCYSQQYHEAQTRQAHIPSFHRCSLRIRPALFPQEGDEATGDRAYLRIVILMAGNDQEVLTRYTPYRDDQTTTFRELCEHGLGHMRGCGGNEDALV